VTWIQIGAALHSHICAAAAATARFFAEQEVKMIIAFACSQANAQLLTEREAVKDALNTCLRPESFMRLENYKVRALAHAPSPTRPPPLTRVDCRRQLRGTGRPAALSGGAQTASGTRSSPP
jgi:hypothetical protein